MKNFPCIHIISLDFKHTFLTPNTINEDLVVDIRGKTFCTMKIGVVCQFNCLPGSPLGPGSPGDPRFPWGPSYPFGPISGGARSPFSPLTPVKPRGPMSPGCPGIPVPGYREKNAWSLFCVLCPKELQTSQLHTHVCFVNLWEPLPGVPDCPGKPLTPIKKKQYLYIQ